jgi:hypothetical protein
MVNVRHFIGQVIHSVIELGTAIPKTMQIVAIE